MVNRRGGFGFGIVVAAAGCGGKVTSPSKPTVMGGADAVAFGTPVGLSTFWDGWCEYSGLEMAMFGGGGGDEGSKEHPCNSVEYEPSVSCDNNACTASDDGRGGLTINPTRPGIMKAHVKFKPRDGGASRTLDLAPVKVLVPTSAKVTRCELWKQGEARVDVDLYADGTKLRHQSGVRIKNGAACTYDEGAFFGFAHVGRHGDFSCPLDATKVDLEVFAPGYTVAATADCVAVFPAPNAASQVSGGRYNFVVSGAYQTCEALLKETRASFLEWGWKEDGAAPAGASSFVASRNGVKAEISIAENNGANGRECRWSLKTDAPPTAIVGTHEFKD